MPLDRLKHLMDDDTLRQILHGQRSVCGSIASHRIATHVVRLRLEPDGPNGEHDRKAGHEQEGACRPEEAGGGMVSIHSRLLLLHKAHASLGHTDIPSSRQMQI